MAINAPCCSYTVPVLLPNWAPPWPSAPAAPHCCSGAHHHAQCRAVRAPPRSVPAHRGADAGVQQVGWRCVCRWRCVYVLGVGGGKAQSPLLKELEWGA